MSGMVVWACMSKMKEAKQYIHQGFLTLVIS